MYFFTPLDERYIVYMGKDKFENEELIRYGWPEDIWFHVDNLSSAHVYIRLPVGETLDDVPPEVIEECCQLVKHNSIKGSKQRSVDVIFTPWSNLRKDVHMEAGQVGFHDDTNVRTFHVEQRDRQILKRINKTLREEFPDLNAERQQRDLEERARFQAAKKEKKRKQAEEAAEAERLRALQSYDGVFEEDNMTSNTRFDDDVDVNAWEEDFM